VLDSGSHEWEGIGGVLDMAGEIEAKSGKTGLHCWKTPKFEHAKFVQRLLRTRIPFIVCLRAKYKSRQTKNEAGKTIIVKDETTSPIQAEDFIFEATCHAEILQNHSTVLTKCSHPGLRACFPKDKTTPITIANGQTLAAWCNSGGKPNGDLAALKKELWQLTEKIHGGDRKKLAQYLWDECLMKLDENLETLTADQMRQIVGKFK